VLVALLLILVVSFALGLAASSDMLPSAPTPLSGSVKIVRLEQVEMLNAKLADVAQVLSHWG
jgi:hypothetical protein